MSKRLCSALLIFCFATTLSAAPLLYSLGTGDGMVYSLVEFDRRGNETTLFGVGLGYNGGLAFDPSANSFYAIYNDMSGLSNMVSITWDGVIENAMPLGEGFYGGLTYAGAPGQFWAVGAGRDGVQNHLYSIDLPGASVAGVTQLGDGDTSFDGGITTIPDLIHGTSLALIGVSYLERGQFTNLYTYSPLTDRFALDGIYRSLIFPAAGGLAADWGRLNYWAIAIDPETFQPILVNFDGAGVNTQFTLTQAYSGLTYAERQGDPPPPPNPIPEPGTWLTAAAGATLIACLARRRA